MVRLLDELTWSAMRPRSDMSGAERLMVQARGEAIPGWPRPAPLPAAADSVDPSLRIPRSVMEEIDRTEPRPTSEANREAIKQGLANKEIPADAVVPGFVENLPLYQREHRNVLGGYLNNPFTDEGRRGIVRQLVQAPAGGHVRRALAGQEVFGHTISGGEAWMAERAVAGATAIGVGLPALIAAADQLNNPQTPGTIPVM